MANKSTVEGSNSRNWAGSGLNRRSFIRTAGLTAIAGAAGGSGLALANTPKVDSSAGMQRLPNGQFDFDTIYNRIGSGCYKWDDQIARFGAENIQVGMGVATMDFQAAPCISEALNKRISHENWGYMMTPDSFVESIVDWNRDRHGYDLDPKSVVISAGVYPGIIAALRTFAEPGSKVILLTPAYSGFYTITNYARTIASDSLMQFKNDRYEIDWNDLESRMTPDTHALILCNPHNPTGNVWSEEDLLRIGEMCLENQIVVLSDEIHCDFVRDGEKYIPFASLPNQAVVDNSMTFKAVSKTFSLAALKNAYFFSTNSVYLERVIENHRPDINALGIIATEAAYRHGGEWFDQLLPYLDDNHSYAEKFIKQHIPQVGITKAQGTYLSWVDMSKVSEAIGAEQLSKASLTSNEPKTAEDVLETWLVENSGVQLNPGTKYGTGGVGHMRMNLGTSRKLIKIALNNMSAAINKAV